MWDGIDAGSERGEFRQMRIVIGGVCLGALMTASVMASASAVSLGAANANSALLEQRGAAVIFGGDLNPATRLSSTSAHVAKESGSWLRGEGIGVDAVASQRHRGPEVAGFTAQAGPGRAPAMNISFELGPKSALAGPEQRSVFGVALGTSPVPEPASLLFLGTGLLGLAHSVRRMRRDKAQPPTSSSQL